VLLVASADVTPKKSSTGGDVIAQESLDADPHGRRRKNLGPDPASAV
jgi:hypothetical protein